MIDQQLSKNCNKFLFVSGLLVPYPGFSGLFIKSQSALLEGNIEVLAYAVGIMANFPTGFPGPLDFNSNVIIVSNYQLYIKQDCY